MADSPNMDEYGRSLSDTDGEADKKKRKSRRRRGKNPRYRPYHTLSPEEKAAKNDADVQRSERLRNERLANGKPMAPFNTTQFLLDDREARAEDELKADLAHEAQERNRIRSISGGNELFFMHNASDQASTSGESEADKEMDREFETEYREVKRERINKLSKSELEQELIDRDRDTEILQDECEKMHAENRQLKELLAANGIRALQTTTTTARRQNQNAIA